jgi:hypothetical protein
MEPSVQYQTGKTLSFLYLNAEFRGSGPGKLLFELRKGDNTQLLALIDLLNRSSPDVVFLSGVDWDKNAATLFAFNQQLTHPYPYILALPGNTGLSLNQDLDGDGYDRGPGDRAGYGSYYGAYGLWALAKWPVEFIRNHGTQPWHDVPDTALPHLITQQVLPKTAQPMPLSSVGIWELKIRRPSDDITAIVFHLTAPVFDSPADENGLRNRDELRYLQALSSNLPEPFLLIGDTNNDPYRGDGDRTEMMALLAAPQLCPVTIKGDDWTVDWGEGLRLRVDYVLPDCRMRVHAARLLPAQAASRHRAIWTMLEPP